MDAILSQKSLPWANQLLGTSKYYIHAYGCFITEIAEILGLTPDVVNERLNAVSGYAADKDGELDEVIWDKIAEAYPGWTATYVSPYDNTAVVEALTKGESVIVQVDAAPIGNPGGLHAVRYIGNGECHDPWDGTVKPTSTYPDVKAFTILTKAEVQAATETAATIEPAENPHIYKGLDLTNVESMKAAIDTWKEVEDGIFIRKDTLPEAPICTLSTLPPHEKEAILNRVHNLSTEVSELLGIA